VSVAWAGQGFAQGGGFPHRKQESVYHSLSGER
jgi:hypothetical protein